MTHYHLVKLARSGKRLTPLLLVSILSLLFFLVPVIIGSEVGQAVLEPAFGTPEEVNASALSSGLLFTLTEFLIYTGAILVVWLWLRTYERRASRTVGLEAPGALRKLGLGAAVGFGAFTVWLLVAYGAGAVRLESSDPQLVGARVLGGVLIVSVGVLIAAAAEEVIFRGWALPVLSARTTPALGVTLSAVLFSLPHTLSNDITLLAMVNIGLLGAVFALWALLEGGIWSVIGFHWLWNFAQFNLYGFDVTESATLGGALVNFAYTANMPFVTTGVVAEDGLFLTLAALAAVVGLYLALTRNVVAQGDHASEAGH